MRNNRRSNRRFTLVEILMVTGMICIIAALIIVTYNGVYRSWSTGNTVAAMKNTHLALDRFRLPNGYLPEQASYFALNYATNDPDPALQALARDLLTSAAPYAFKFSDHIVRIFDDFGPKPPAAGKDDIHPIYYIYPYKNTGTLALFSRGKDGVWNGDTDDIIYLPNGLDALKLEPGFYMVQLSGDGTITCDPEDIEPLAN